MTINDNNIPFFGDLGLPLQMAFEFRKSYKEHAYPLLSINDKKPIDYWYETPLYGRVDRFGNAVFLSESRLKQIKNPSRKTFLAIDFVVDAFTDLQDYFTRAIITRAIDRDNSMLTDITPTAAWTSILKKHHSIMKNLYRSFLSEHLAMNTMVRDKILTFDDFFKEFMLFMETILPQVPMTRTGYIASNFCSPLSSGLVIEIGKYQHNKDIMKDAGFFQDPNYEFYKEATKRFGFFIDKNAPWRLTADITSTRMIDYMNRAKLTIPSGEYQQRGIDPNNWPSYSSYGIDPFENGPNSLFNKYYYRSYVQDIDIFKVYILDMYNGFVSVFPKVKKSIIRRRRITGYKMYERKFMTQDELEKNYDSNFWIELYAKIRNFETDAQLEENYFRRKIKRAKAINKNVDFYSALWYINRQFRGYCQVDILEQREEAKQKMKEEKIRLSNLFGNKTSGPAPSSPGGSMDVY